VRWKKRKKPRVGPRLSSLQLGISSTARGLLSGGGGGLNTEKRTFVLLEGLEYSGRAWVILGEELCHRKVNRKRKE